MPKIKDTNQKGNKTAEIIRIRRFRKTDLDGVYSLIQKTIDVSYRKVYPPEAIEFFKEFHNKENILKDTAAGYTVVAERNGEILGTSTLIDSHIQRTFVNPFCQRLGIGGMLAKELERKASLKKSSHITLEASIVSRHFWDARGYVIQEETFILVKNGQKLVYYKMSKENKKHGMQFKSQ
jgi:ribosomal protein S18 acetylase RimI-like enzyme